MLAVYLLILVVGFFALIKGADLFVEGSSSMAGFFRVPGLVIGLVIVAPGTSTPELAVSTLAAVNGYNEIALSNVVGSNIFNLLFVLGVCALISVVPVDEGINKRDFPVSIITTVFVFFAACSAVIFSGNLSGLAMTDVAGKVSRPLGLFLIMMYVVYIAYLIYDARKNPQKEEEREARPVIKSLGLIIIGLVLVVTGGNAVVTGAKEIAGAFGMTETFIGLTIVAVGTSLPELVTSIVAARRGEVGLALGNVLGSNIFNLLFILGLSAFINPVSVNTASVWDIIILIAVTVISYIFCLTRRRISFKEGVGMLLIYVADMVFAVVR